jgi:hypothetical protein
VSVLGVAVGVPESSPGPAARGLRIDSRATAMVTAAARIARPRSWPPISRMSSGSPTDRSFARTAYGPGGADGEACDEGLTFGNAVPGSPVGGSVGNVPWGSTPGGSVVPGGRSPPGSAAGAGAELAFGLAVTLMVADPDVVDAACGEVAVTSRWARVPAVPFGTASRACNSTAWLALSPATEHVAVPVLAQTTNLAESLLGVAFNLTVAVPLVPDVSHTQMAYLVCPRGCRTFWVPMCWIDRHRLAVGDGVGVGVAVGDGVALPVALGVAGAELLPGEEPVVADAFGLGLMDAVGVVLTVGSGVGLGVGVLDGVAVALGLAAVELAGLGCVLGAGDGDLPVAASRMTCGADRAPARA